jgi:tight adherence protein B
VTTLVLLLVFFGTLVVVGGGLVFVNRRRLASVAAARNRISDAPDAGRGTGRAASTILRDDRVSEIRALNELLSGRGLTVQLAGELARAGSRQRPGEFLLITALSGLSGMTLVSYAIGPLAALVGLAVGMSLPWLFLRRRQRARSEAFERQLPDALDLLTNSLKAGYSLQAAMEFVGRETTAPLGPEFLRFYDEQRLGVDVRTALLALQDRIGTDDARMFVTSLILQRETGGNLAELLQTIGNLIRQRLQFRGQLAVLTAEPKGAARLLSAMPLVLFVVIGFLNPAYIQPMISSPGGRLALGVAVLLVGLGYAIMSRIADVEI